MVGQFDLAEGKRHNNACMDGSLFELLIYTVQVQFTLLILYIYRSCCKFVQIIISMHGGEAHADKCICTIVLYIFEFMLIHTQIPYAVQVVKYS